MSGIIGAENQFGKDFNSPDSNLQGVIVSIYDVYSLLINVFFFPFFRLHSVYRC